MRNTTMSDTARLIRPPQLRTDEPASASRLELFFDLAYVLVVLELADQFLHDPDWSGAVIFAGLFTTVWSSWVGFTLYANRFDTDDVVFRIGMLAATLAIAGCAAAAAGATGAFAVPFAASFLAGRVVLFLLYLRAWRHVRDARATIARYLTTIAVSIVLWAVSLGIDGDARFWWWAAAVLVGSAGPLLATRTGGGAAPLHVEHLPERFGLLVILVLGEAVGGAATGVHDTSWATLPVAVGVAGFVLAAAMWWVHFDTSAAAGADALQDDDSDDQAGGSRQDLFVYAHLPLAMGVVAVGVGVEELVLHPQDLMPSPGAWILAAGLVLFLVGAGLILVDTVVERRAVVILTFTACVFVGVITVMPFPNALGLVGTLAALTAALAAAGTLRPPHHR
jgi:low temperature requirement protein LtrA